MGCTRDSVLSLRVQQYDICIRSWQNHSFGGINVKHLSSSCAGGPDILGGAHETRVDHLIPYHMHPLFDSIYSIWYFTEVISPHGLLCAVEHRMVCCNNLQHSRGKGILERGPMLRGSNGGAHHILSCNLEIRIPHLALIDGQARHNGLTNHPLPHEAGLCNLFHCIYAHDVDHIQWCVYPPGKADSASSGFSFKNSWSREGMSLGSCNAGSEYLCLALCNSIAVLTMYLCDCSQFLTAQQPVYKLFITHHQRILVS
mmetsp:Transcript_31260/g.88635  ORF Transcript_31260/g.88635 Transcript_31260/m.88635 type:complete len:257 (+) Transcript_31260:387-1157(+)